MRMPVTGALSILYDQITRTEMMPFTVNAFFSSSSLTSDYTNTLAIILDVYSHECLAENVDDESMPKE